MPNSHKQPPFLFLLIIISVVALLRVPMAATQSPLGNFTPIGAIALFAGSYFKPAWKAYLFPLSIVFIGDLLINTLVYKGQYGLMYNGWHWYYLIYITITLIGRLVLQNRSLGRIALTGIGSSVLFWLVADCIVWAGGGIDLRTMTPLSRDIQGLLQCYAQGLPFALNFLYGTLLYSAVLFGSSYFVGKPQTSPVTAR